LIPANLPEPFGNLLETFTTLSYLAARTETIRLGTGILVLPQRDPLLVAKQAATVHHLSGGRFTLGLGVGWIAQEYSYLRTDFASRGQLADEYAAAIRALFERDHPAYHGDHINFSDALFSPRPQVPIPIVIGGSSKPALRLSPETASGAIDEMNRTGHRQDFTVSLRLQVRVGGAVDGAEPGTALHGDADAVVEQLHKYSDIGIEQVVIEPFASNLADFVEQMRLFAHEAAPDLLR
jgi:probable F420-dependent oxidoreductase